MISQNNHIYREGADADCEGVVVSQNNHIYSEGADADSEGVVISQNNHIYSEGADADSEGVVVSLDLAARTTSSQPDQLDLRKENNFKQSDYS